MKCRTDQDLWSWSVRIARKYKGREWTHEQLILTLMAQAPSTTWVCGPWRSPIARRPCPYSGCLWLVWASAHASSQYFPVPLRPLWLGGPFFSIFCSSNPNPSVVITAYNSPCKETSALSTLLLNFLYINFYSGIQSSFNDNTNRSMNPINNQCKRHK
jgi:hypothetical protein